jgi:hypothetical protein
MSAPPGFNEQASNLPDPGVAAAPIHVMRGGGGAAVDPEQVGGKPFSMEEENILESYGLTDSAITQHIQGFDDEFKNTFLTQVRSGKCEQKGNSITNRDCWAVTTVIKALIQAKFAQGNAFPLPGMVPETVLDKEPEDVSPKAPAIPKIGTPTGVDPLANNENEDDTRSDAARLAANAARQAAAEDTVAPCIRGPDSIEGLDDSDALSRMSAVSPDNVNIVLPPTPAVPAASSSTPSGRMDGSEYNFPPNAYSLALAENMVRSRETPATPAAAALTPSMQETRDRLRYGTAAARAATAARARTTRLEATAAAKAAAYISPDYFLENPANFRKGQYGINLNANDSKRFYSNAIVGTKRMRIRGRNATNIKARYNAKKTALTQRAAQLATERNAATRRATEEQERASRELADAERSASQALERAKMLQKTLKSTKKTTTAETAKTAEEARRAALAAGTPGVKKTLGNRWQSFKNRFKRGGSRKTRRSTRRGNRR